MTKDREHFRRSGKIAPNIQVNPEMEAYSNQEIFLKNEHNKSQLISILSRRLEDVGYETRTSVSDADTLIVSTAIEHASQNNVFVIAYDTDILVLLVHHWKINMKNIFFLSEAKNRGNKKPNL